MIRYMYAGIAAGMRSFYHGLMENMPEDSLNKELIKGLFFLKLTGLRAEAYAQGKAWVHSRIADLKIDLHLTTEHGEGENTNQVDEILQQIQQLESTLNPSLFDPDPQDTGNSFLQSAAADLACFVLTVAKQKRQDGDALAVLQDAKDFLQTPAARSEAHEWMERILHRPGVVFEDVDDVIDRAGHLLSCIQV